MKKSYAALMAEIAKLEKQAESARKAEVAGVVARIREAIEAYGLTRADLGFGSGGARRAAAAAEAGAGEGGPSREPAGRSTVGVPKYRDPQTGKTWTGRGKPPTWIVGVKDRSALLIDAPGAGAEAAAGKGERKARAGAKRSSPGKRAAARKGGRRGAGSAERTAAVQIESGVATE